jgi:DNA repair protein SbcC/Rad50
MKITKILLRNINSFSGEHRIDFTTSPLAKVGIFAIVGPTGAGKSTLLDAITLALFNQIPRFEEKISTNKIEASGSILTHGQTECRIEVEYLTKDGKNYRSVWSIRKTSTGSYSDYHMELVDLSTDKILPLKKSEVPDENKKLIGLSYDQFIKSILLSQGEFSRFLKSDKKKRGQLLEDITGTGIYRKLGKKAHEIDKEFGGEYKMLETLLHQEKAKLVPTELVVFREERLEVINGVLNRANEQIVAVDKQVALKNEIEKISKDIEIRQNVLAKTQQDCLLFEQTDLPRLQAHERAEPLRELIYKHQEKERELQRLQKEIGQANEQLCKAQNDLQDVLAKITRLLNGVATEAEAIEQLQKYRDKVVEQQALANRRQSEYKICQDIIQKHLSELRISTLQQLNWQHIEQDALLQIKAIAEERKTAIDALKQTAQLLPNESEQDGFGRLSLIIAQYQDLNTQVSIYIEKKKLLDGTLTELAKQEQIVETQTPQLAQKEEYIKQIASDIKALEEEKNKWATAFQFEKDRHKLLKSQEPCPLCGSTEHPYISHYANAYVESDLAIKEHKKQEKQLQADINTHKAILQTAQNIIENSIKNKEQYEKDCQQQLTDITTIKENLGLANIGKPVWIEEQITQLRKQQASIQQLGKTQQNLDQLRQLYRETNNLQQCQNEVASANKALQAIYQGKNIHQDCDKIQQAFTQTQTTIQQKDSLLKALSQQLTQQEKQYAESQEALNQTLSESHWNSIEEAQSCLLETSVVKNIREQQQQFSQQIHTLQEFINNQQEALTAKQATDGVTTLYELLALKTTLQVQTKEVEAEKMDILVALKGHQNALDEIQKIEINLAEQKKKSYKWKLLNDYIGDSKGDTFSNFAQGLTLVRLVGLANKQLNNLSDRYLLDKPNEQKDAELMILDAYMGNERRSVKTLSGGETFLVSLSMALALSDLASKNVRIESLFIDEGFGTLDPETLDIALSTLEKIQAKGEKSIGIISHVDAIKERISTQIQLEKNNRGHSKIIVIS